jgi:Poly-beta-hydroxybutyrate polymerase N terminal
MPVPEISTSGSVPSNGAAKHLPSFERDADRYTKAGRTGSDATAVTLSAPPPSPSTIERDSYASTAFGDVVDRSLHAAVARLTAGLSPAALMEAYTDWVTHLATSPGKLMQLLEKATKKLCTVHRTSAPG